MSNGPGGSVLRVVQLNAGSLIERDWADRRHEIVAWLQQLRADVVCLEEIWQDDNTPNTAEWIAAQASELEYHCAFGGAPFAPDVWPDPSLLFGSAVLSRWPIEDFTHHLLPIGPGGNVFVQGCRGSWSTPERQGSTFRLPPRRCPDGRPPSPPAGPCDRRADPSGAR